MRAAVIVFPGSNCDRDLQVALTNTTGSAPEMVWHKETTLPDGLDFIGIPGGYSFGDYLRSGAIAARAPIMRAVVDFANRGGMVLGICNGFQILIETGLLPGALMRNAGLKFVSRDVGLTVATENSPYTTAYSKGQTLRVPVAHHDGNFVADEMTVKRLRDQDRIAFTYNQNPNGSVADIAGILSENRRILGMMPHPERLADQTLGGTDGIGIFKSAANALISA